MLLQIGDRVKWSVGKINCTGAILDNEKENDNKITIFTHSINGISDYREVQIKRELLKLIY